MFDIVTVKSKGFNRGLNAVYRVNRINSNLMEVGHKASRAANQIAPLQDGDLRGSMETERGKLVYVTYWRTDYARFRYFINNKNPQTREWAKKAHLRYKSEFLRKMSRSAI